MHTTTALETCANCGATIGKLETPHVYQQHVVCSACHGRLSAASDEITDDQIVDESPVPASTVIPYARPTAPNGASEPEAGGPAIVCPNPNCKYCGPSRRKAKGSTAVLIILLLCWVLPGVLYLVFFSGYVLLCPRCGMKVRDE